MSMRVQVAGIGGVFFKARDPVALAAWYREHLGVQVAPGGTHAVFATDPGANEDPESPAAIIWSVFPTDTSYFGDGSASLMINYRVADLDAMLAQLRAAGVWVADEVQDGEYGRFGWTADPEGNRIELWQPPPVA